MAKTRFVDVPSRTRDQAFEVIAVVAAHYGTTTAKILAPGRGSQMAWIRHVAVWACVCHGGIRLQPLTGVFRRDHSTLSNSVSVVEGAVRNGDRRAKDLPKEYQWDPATSFSC